MFKSLFTPLKTKFEQNRTPPPPLPSTALSISSFTSHGTARPDSPEDFRRDELIQTMRQAVEEVKTAHEIHERLRLLSDIHRVMVEEVSTKDVFRELDGFLAMMSLLSSLHKGSDGSAEDERDLLERMEVVRLTLAITCLAIMNHSHNKDYFETRVTFDALTQAVSPFSSDPRTLDQIFGYLLSMAVDDFSFSGAFATLRNAASKETGLAQLEHRLTKVFAPQAILAMSKLLPNIPSTDDTLPYFVYKIIEKLALFNHRNQAALNSLCFGRILFERLYIPEGKQHAMTPDIEAIMHRLSRKMLGVGASTTDVRVIFKRAAREDDTLDDKVIELLRASMRVKWPEHFSFERDASIELKEENTKGPLAPNGFTFMCWISLESFPKERSSIIFGIRTSQIFLFRLGLLPSGKLELSTNVVREPSILEESVIPKGRWTHVTLVYYPSKASNPSIRIFLDGVLTSTLNWSYPKFEPGLNEQLIYNIGDLAPMSMSWSLASAYLLCATLANEVPRLIHHLGPRYQGLFQDPGLTRFLTYSTATSLNIHLFSLATANGAVSLAKTKKDEKALISALKSGLGITEEQLLFALSPTGAEMRDAPDFEGDGKRVSVVKNAVPNKTSEVAEIRGNAIVYRPQCLDVGVWEIGGAAVLLRLVELADSSHELNNALGIFADAIKTSWQNSEDIERIRGYEILAGILRAKSRLINLAAFQTLFEFLGLDFKTPEASTITNTVAYRFLALDFEIWCRAPKEIQQAHLEHFVTLLQTSRYKRFNVKQRLRKFSLVRKFLFVLQTNMYQHDVLPSLVAALKVAAIQNFSVDDAIKPIVAYLGANLHENSTPSNVSPISVVSRVDRDHARIKAEQVLECLTSILSTPARLQRFTTALPLTRICLLLLGEHPSSVVASQILMIIGLTLAQSSSFNRKFELVSGWTVLRNALPPAWDPSVHVAAFDVFMGRLGSQYNVHSGSGSGKGSNGPRVVCPYILPAIIASLDRGLHVIIADDETNDRQNIALESTMEVLVEELIDLHSSSLSYRELFKSHQTTSLMIQTCKSFATHIAQAPDIRTKLVRLTEKITHLILMLALDNHVNAVQKQELLNIIRTLEESVGENNITSSSLLTSNGNGHSRRRSQLMQKGLQMLGDRAYQKSLTRIHEWRNTISRTERKRLRKQFQDLQEHHRQAERLNEWRISLIMEPGLWSHSVERKWRLDETEGPLRIRKKLEPEQVKILSVKVNEETSRIVEEPEDDIQSIVQLEVPPWAESYEISSTAAEEDAEWAEDVREDKHRRVRHELEPGDIIEAVHTATRIVGVDSSPGLLILGKTHLYMLDGLVEGPDGEVIEAKDAPRNLFSVPGSLVELDGIQRAQRWPYEQIAAFSKRTYLFRDVALEIYFKDTRNLLVVFGSKQERYIVHNRLLASQPESMLGDPNALTASVSRTPLFSKVSAKILNGFRDEISTAQRKWQAREISNFTYISIINQTSGRTPSDATQYPIYPWVLKDYTSDTLDLKDESIYRDLRKPMGALTPAREKEASGRYEGLEAIGEKPFHYGTHFSSSMITCHFLMRLEPFSHMFKRLQGGSWDLPDRLFTEIRRAYKSASEDSRGDVRELIPEFFTCPEFLVNASNIDFGTQISGEKIHNVRLPPWAKQDPLLFIITHRRALESDYVSEHLPEWIDLIWGSKQRDPASLNVFHPLSYEGSIDLDSISDEIEREATVGIIHNFGQTPRKIFTTPHPERFMHGITTLPLGTLHGIEEDYQLLEQSSKPTRDIGCPVSSLVLDVFAEKILPCREDMLYVPSYPHEYVSWGYLDQSLRLYSDQKLIQCYEFSSCSSATFADSDTLITGSNDCKVRIWRLSRKEQTSFSLSYILNGHREKVFCVVASRAWSLIVSGSEDGSAMLWELNRAQYVRAIHHGSPVHLAAINESTGYIATCSRETLSLHTINGHQIVSIDVGAGLPDQRIISLAFHEREWSYSGVLATGTAGGSIALRTWNADDTPAGQKARWQFQTLRTLKCRSLDDGTNPAVTALRFVGECLYFGQNDGKVYSWEFPE
ncbi:hypothetical protein M422DRAFT_209006 [Sphaerobolus stellatus SS14]|uniref:Beach-domain-containing protein n=1 Tax=Sphaerobolus stellatus (strain SS14) TaxID=990650 RepID=A0A0C9V5G6_SPHS4|nr:hypothetical protein M422DRAFT_209006 [Sphaerobolus stellatus SS14]